MMKMATRHIVSFINLVGVRRCHISLGNLIHSLKIGQPGQLTRASSVTAHRFCNLERELTVQVDLARSIHSSSYLEAGHSKWKNIQHIKAANDREKGIKSNLLARKVQLLLEKNPETDPKLNSELANLIKWARSNSLTNDVINNTIDKQVKLRDPSSIITFAGRGPLNTGIIIECFSLKPHHTKSIIQSVVKKYGFNLNASADDLFDHKGVIDIELSIAELATAQANPENFSLDKYVEVAINTGAEDVSLESDGEKPYLQFLCDPTALSKVTTALDNTGLNIINSEKTYIPKVVVPVSQESFEGFKKLTNKLDLNSDVVKYHFNVELES